MGWTVDELDEKGLKALVRRAVKFNIALEQERERRAP